MPPAPPSELPPCTTTPGDQLDVSVELFISSVRGPFSSTTAYTGPALLRKPMRLTDHFTPGGCGPAGTTCTATMTDVVWNFPMSCSSGTCVVSTSYDVALGANGIIEQTRMEVTENDDDGLGVVAVYDPGPDGTLGVCSTPFSCGSGDEAMFMNTGWFAP